jgi:hypothetical protein
MSDAKGGIMTKKRPHRQEKLSRLAYIPAFASFIPLLGVPFGIAAILWGSTRWQRGGKPVVIISFAGILLTVLLYGSLFFFASRLANSQKPFAMQTSLVQTRLGQIVKDIEYYKLINGEYPPSLHELDVASGLEKNYEDVSAYPLLSFSLWNKRQPKHDFYYRRLNGGSGYYLFGFGLDDKPFSDDDVYPAIQDAASGRLGIVTPTPDLK